jgi:hypothetical protein
LFAVSGVLSAELGPRFSFATLESWKPLVLMFGAVALLIAFGPLLAFVPKLVRARLTGLIEADAVASEYGRAFRERRSEIEKLAHHTEVYRETIAHISPFLFTVRDALALLAATLLPVVPVMVAQIPAEDWRVLLALLTGGRLG